MFWLVPLAALLIVPVVTLIYPIFALVPVIDPRHADIVVGFTVKVPDEFKSTVPLVAVVGSKAIVGVYLAIFICLLPQSTSL